MPILLVLALSGASGPTTPYRVDYAIDGTLTAGMALVLGISEAVVKPTLKGGLSCDRLTASGACDPAQLNAIDRSVVGNHAQGWVTVSDVGAGLAYTLPLAAEALDVALSGSQTPMGDWLADFSVMAESLTGATLLTEIIKFSVRRPRPSQYTQGAGSIEQQLSFPSGHASSTAAVTGAYAVTFALRHPQSPWRWAVVAGAAALTGVTSYGRVGGGKHFYSDVVAGAALGATFGIVVPLLHRRKVSISPLVPAASRVSGVVLTATF